MTPHTRVIPVDPSRPDPAAIAAAARVILAGGLVAFPTETVYGLGADATSDAAVSRIYEAKGRPSGNPLIVHTHDVASARAAVADWPGAADALAEAFWPGPLTLVLPRPLHIACAVSAGTETVGVRVPDDPVAFLLLGAASRPVAAPSANRSTGVSPTCAAHVLKDLDGRIDLILDAGPTPVGIESTVLDLTTDPPRVLRPGAIRRRQIEAVLGRPVAQAATPVADGSAAKSPGQAEVHYAPRTPVTVVEPGQISRGPWPIGARIGLIVAGPNVAAGVEGPLMRVDWSDPAIAARELYATLHRWDDGSLDAIRVVLPPDDDAWRAVRDRLWRASRRWSREGREDKLPEGD